jgi:two-component system, chemotaxis family, chemotaxis protein CheY
MTVATLANSLWTGWIGTMNLDHAMPILVVDDYKTMSRILGLLLKQVGFSDVDEACDGDEALAKMRERKYGLVISDWYMQPTNGLGLLEQVRADEALRATPFIMVSAEANAENVSAARKAGASGYITKPFDAETLRGRIEIALQLDLKSAA